jgi:diketogulonate reductase-like aldo/keto reductase
MTRLTDHEIPKVTLADGTKVSALGLGTWNMGDRAAQAEAEVAALRHGISLGLTLIDTAEMYGDGGAEEIVARALGARRDDAFIVSKVYPQNAGTKSMAAACDRSLQRLRLDCIDLYLLHWRGRIPLAETVGAFERLRAAGKIRRWGVSNFDVADMEELLTIPDGRNCAVNQVLYNLTERGVEWRLLELCDTHGIRVMAYSPVAQGALSGNRKLAAIAQAAGMLPVQLALAWVLARSGVIAIPQSSNLAHIDEIRAAAGIKLDAATITALDAAFPPPKRSTPLSVI